VFSVSSTTLPPSGGEPEPEELPLAEIIKNNTGKWVGFLVTARDKNSQPTRGKVVAVDQDRYLLRQALIRYKDVCIIYCGEPPYPLLL